MIGQTLGHYRILEEIGAGGMGVVYRAHDERLDRDVALKILPAGALADEAARHRFRKEALALAKLTHSNIAHIYDFDTQNSTDFLVMECVPGQTLTQKLNAGSLPEKEVAALGGQIAAALEEAHERGVVHRDLKPGNILVTPKGQAKVLDFGLAKLLRPPGDAEATQTFSETQGVAGTLPYMAPEQLRSEALDGRTDIYALGCVLYEMATGRRAFPEDTAPRLTDAILHQPPVSARAVNTRISPELDRIILKCLEKDPETRYQSAKELVVDLRRLATPSAATAVAERPAIARVGWRKLAIGGAVGVVAVVALLAGFNVGGVRERLLGKGSATPQIRSLAVLPLENFSRDPEQEYFADGMTEALISNLAQVSSLRVISRTSVMQYKGARESLPQIARELNVDAVVQGSVQRSGDRVRITAQLIHAPTDRHLWAREYERELRDILSLQAEVARAVVEEIKVKLTPQEQARLASVQQISPKAYEAYLKGRINWYKRTEDGLHRAIEYFNRAIALEPRYALAYAGLADTYNFLGVRSGGQAPRESFPRAKAAASKALEFDESSAAAHTALAFASFYYDRDWATAEHEFRRAIELEAAYAPAHQWLSHVLMATDRSGEALAEAQRAVELEPVYLPAILNLGWKHYFSREYDQAIAQYRKVLELDPDFELGHCFLGQALVQKGRPEEAIVEIQKAVVHSGRVPFYLAELAQAYTRAGKRDEARKILGEMSTLARRRYVSPYYFAEVHVALGEQEKALDWLDKAYADRADALVWIQVEPKLDPLRSVPRFQDLLRRMNFPP